MKKNIFTFIAILCFSGISFSQNYHFEYSSDVFDFNSSVVLVNESTYEIYMVATNTYGQLIISKLGYSDYLDPDINNTKIFKMSDLIVLKGGFFDTENNIIIYGYVNPDYKGIIIKIPLSGTSLTYSKSNIPNTQVVDGCYSESILTGILSKTYDFIVSNSIFMRIKTDLYDNQIAYRKPQQPNAKFLSVDWDTINKRHIVSGIYGDAIIIGSYPIAQNLNPPSFSRLSFPQFYGDVIGSNRIILTNEDSVVYICRDVYINDINNMSTGLLLIKYNYISHNVMQRNLYRFGLDKVWILDVSKTSDNLFVLGHYNGSDTLPNNSTLTFERRFIAQFNLYDTTDFKVMFMKDYNLTDFMGQNPVYSLYDFTNTIYLNNMTFYPNNESVLSSGSINKNAYIIETIDLNYDYECDSVKDVVMEYLPIVKNNYTFLSQAGTPWFGSTPHTVTTSGTIMFDFAWLCPIFENKRLNNLRENEDIFLLEENKKQNIDVEIFDNKYFVCKNFTGDCYFKIYDFTGRILNEGITQNEQLNNISINKSGIYIISVRDENNQIVQEKVMILK